MTKDEAKRKWCPFARLARHTDDGKGGWNRLQIEDGRGQIPTTAMCVTEHCMAWCPDTTDQNHGYCSLC